MKCSVLIVHVLMISFLTSGQTHDSCQCRLLFGNGFNPTLVTYHHDSLVTFTRAIGPTKKVFDLNLHRQLGDTLLGMDMYDWNTRASTTLQHQKGSIGRTFNNRFYIEYPNQFMDSGEVFHTFWLGKDRPVDPSVTLLYGRRTVFEKPERINQQTCNCFTELDYFYTPIRTPLHYPGGLDTIRFSDSHLPNDSNLFVPTDSRCYFGFERHKACYLKGIGVVPLQEPYPASTTVKVLFLTKACDKFLKTRFFNTGN